MKNVTIIFDEKSLVLTKDDYTAITKYSKLSEDTRFGFMDDDKCFVVVKKKDLRLAVFFTKVELEGRECFEISRILHKLDATPNLPEQLEEFNYETGNMIKKVFNLLDEAISTSRNPIGNSKHAFGFKYYIRNLKTKSYDIQHSLQRVNIASFVQNLSYVFGITD
ncbi:MAG: hypothetical protein U1C51_07775 [Candidatus Izemoplasmatales bacterium]|jgi:hypothetical protein|nr:hypothetical protein [bacterium]MDZ4197120.1 hypothetical protein [Candidatus Izemoplasmatales bacterium]